MWRQESLSSTSVQHASRSCCPSLVTLPPLLLLLLLPALLLLKQRQRFRQRHQFNARFLVPAAVANQQLICLF